MGRINSGIPLLLYISAILFLSCSKDIPVALMTKLESGSIVGSSEVIAVRRFRSKHPDSHIKIQEIDDSWDPAKTVSAFSNIQKRGIKFIITSHTSACAVAIAEEINSTETLTLIAGATTDTLSGQDDWILRIIPDVNIEQRAVARAIAPLKGTRLLLLRDLDNSPYTLPGSNYFMDEWIKGGEDRSVQIEDIHADRLSLSDLKTLFQKKSYNILYIMIGGYRATAGNIAQLSYSYHPDATILFTPWMYNPDLVNSAGPALKNSYFATFFPKRSKAPAMDAYLSAIEEEFNFTPTLISLKVYEALCILHEAFLSGARKPRDVKQYILNSSPVRTDFGYIEFDAFGDSSSDFYLIDDIPGEFRK